MSAERTVLAPWLQQQLQELLQVSGHAWLLQGPAGLGQLELGLALARARLCEHPQPGGACGACPSCHGVDVHTHPDLLLLVPEAVAQAHDWPWVAGGTASSDSSKRKPSQDIRVDALRMAVEFAQRTSARGRGKVVLIYPAERMNAISANTLLKTLEEPAGDTSFILCSNAARRLLPTIRSRCLLHTMRWPAPEQARTWLVAQGVAEGDAITLLGAAGGRAHAALDWQQARVGADAWLALPKKLAQHQPTVLDDLSIAQATTQLQKLCHDLLARELGGQPRFFPASALPLAAPVPALLHWWQVLQEQQRRAGHPLNEGLAREYLLDGASRALNSRPSA